MEFIAAEHGPDDVSRSFFPRSLTFMWSRCAAAREAVLRGDVTALPQDVSAGSRFSHLYAALPVYYDDDFKSVVVENGDAVAIIWLVPITDGEARFVAERGWDAFEQELIERDPDLMDLNRESIA